MQTWKKEEKKKTKWKLTDPLRINTFTLLFAVLFNWLPINEKIWIIYRGNMRLFSIIKKKVEINLVSCSFRVWTKNNGGTNIVYQNLFPWFFLAIVSKSVSTLIKLKIDKYQNSYCLYVNVKVSFCIFPLV